VPEEERKSNAEKMQVVAKSNAEKANRPKYDELEK
jgi:hypothetical protein